MWSVPLLPNEFSTPKFRSRVRRALPEIWLIWLLRNALNAEFMVKLLVLPSARYRPVVSMVTASLPRSSFDID